MNVIIDERKENAMTFNKVLLSWIVILIITTSIYLFWQLGDINDVFNQSILKKIWEGKLVWEVNKEKRNKKRIENK